MKGELWIKQNWELFKEKSQDQLKAKMAESSRFKMYRSEFIPCNVMCRLVELVLSNTSVAQTIRKFQRFGPF